MVILDEQRYVDKRLFKLRSKAKTLFQKVHTHINDCAWLVCLDEPFLISLSLDKTFAESNSPWELYWVIFFDTLLIYSPPPPNYLKLQSDPCLVQKMQAMFSCPWAEEILPVRHPSFPCISCHWERNNFLTYITCLNMEYLKPWQFVIMYASSTSCEFLFLYLYIFLSYEMFTHQKLFVFC